MIMLSFNSLKYHVDFIINAIYNMFLSWTVEIHVPKKERVPEILSLQKQR